MLNTWSGQSYYHNCTWIFKKNFPSKNNVLTEAINVIFEYIYLLILNTYHIFVYVMLIIC